MPSVVYGGDKITREAAVFKELKSLVETKQTKI